MRRRAVDKPGAAAPKPATAPVMTDVKETLGPTITESFFEGENDQPVPPFSASGGERAVAEAEAERVAADVRRADREKRAVKKADELTMPGGFGRIITHQFTTGDTYLEYTELRGKLRSEGRASALSYGELVDALDQAEDAAHRAAELCAQAKSAHDEFEFDARVIASGLRRNALDKLEERKAQHKVDTKTAGKAITEADIEAEIAAEHPDEFLELESRRGRARRSMQLFEDLAVRLSERAKDLRQMVARSHST